MAASAFFSSHSEGGAATPPAKRFAPGSPFACANRKAPLPRRSASSVSLKSTAARQDAAAAVAGENVERYRLYHPALLIFSAAESGRIAEGVRFSDAESKRKVYQLVFDVLHHREVIEDLLIESGFYSKNCDLHGQESLVMLMAYDYQDRRFALKIPHDRSENVPSLVLKVGEALSRHRVKLNATLARMRVKSNALSTTQLLSEASYLEYQAVVTEPYYTRVNRNKVRNFQVEIVAALRGDGFTLCGSEEELHSGEKAFHHLHRNLVGFSTDVRGSILRHQLLTEGYLLPQDCASYFFVEGLRDILSQCTGDVIVTHCNTGVEVAHIASMLSEGVAVRAYGVLPMQMESLTGALHLQDINNVEFVHAPFSHADPCGEDLANVSAIVCLPPSSLSTVTQPVDFITQEGDQFVPLLLSEKKKSLTKSLPKEQSNTLAHALAFSQCEHIVYAVRSREERETADIVAAALEQQGGKEGKREFVLCQSDHDHSAAEQPQYSESDAGYHVTLLERKPEDPGPTPSEVIARAITTGMLSGDGIDIGRQHHIQTKRKKKKAPRIFSQHKGVPLTISARNKMTAKKTSAQNLNTRRPFH